MPKINEQKKKIYNSLSKAKQFKSIVEFLNSNEKELRIRTLSGSYSSLIISRLHELKLSKLLLIVESIEKAESYYHDLKIFDDKNSIALLTEPQKNVRFKAEKLDQHLVWLLDGLSTILNSQNSIAVCTPDVFDIKVPAGDEIKRNTLKLEKEQVLDFDELIRILSYNGFDRKDFVSVQGDMAVRGGILDIFPVGLDSPLRIEFWGNSIESLREFDPLSQRSIKSHESIEFLSSVFHDESNNSDSTLIDYLDDTWTIVVDSPEKILSEFENFQIPQFGKKIVINGFGRTDIEYKSSSQSKFSASIQYFCSHLIELSTLRTTLVLCAEGKIHSERFRELIENGLNSDDSILLCMEYGLNASDIINNIIWISETLSNGFEDRENQLALFTEHEVFDRLRLRDSRKTTKGKSGISLQELKQLNIGDLIVHSDKGVGRFDGFETVTMGGSSQDSVRLIFEGGDILYVSLNYVNKIQKYSAQEGVAPKLSKLGSSEWSRKKERTKKRIKDIARDLIKLYAKRKASKGFAFGTDTIWQKEFEASFIYEDTPDQATATSEAKRDMEDETPMDRLICGDVGFGKTEVAVRTAFKCVEGGKQVAVLVPTTILAQQHYMTFRDRLNRYPFNVEVLSRFRSKKEQKEVVQKLSEGKVDILIGTHRILSKDIQFKDIGLLVIDEEHRFGVAAKEKLRSMRENVDTISMTATPIPRTLNFSLMGARDLSVIETPPRNRLPVKTEVIEWENQKIVDVIHSEIERRGQIFFVSDKVHDLEKIAMDMRMLMPTVRFGVAHGQMKPSELEDVMEKFIEGKFDVLVTTKIVESGLDIPNANTMIINRAQNFGLAELYQLRGRVGRSNTQAYCYLIIPPVSKLAIKSLTRLQAVEEFTDLGSGFQLAMRDMEIRGTGNLLGAEQSGFINDIGYELYQRVLDEAVGELKAEEFSDLFKDHKPRHSKYYNEDVAIQLDTDALIPPDYIATDTDRFHFYKKLYNSVSIIELDTVIEEMIDRFGKLPKQVIELIFAVKIRIIAVNTGFERIVIRPNLFIADFPSSAKEDYWNNAFPYLAEFIQTIPESKIIQSKKKVTLEVPLNSRDEAMELLWKFKKTLEILEDN